MNDPRRYRVTGSTYAFDPDTGFSVKVIWGETHCEVVNDPVPLSTDFPEWAAMSTPIDEFLMPALKIGKLDLHMRFKEMGRWRQMQIAARLHLLRRAGGPVPLGTCLDFDAAKLERRFRTSYADEVALWLSFFRYPERVEVGTVRVVSEVSDRMGLLYGPPLTGAKVFVLEDE